MNAKRLLLVILLLASAVILVYGFFTQREISNGEPVTISGVTVPPLPELDPDQIELGQSIYTQNCASCHGENLEGQENWKQPDADGKLKAPPQDSSGHTWHHPDDLLFSIIANGSDPTFSNMPAFEQTLTASEMVAVLDFIKNSWEQDEREFQWWLTARDR